jgi:hypothetical protein
VVQSRTGEAATWASSDSAGGHGLGAIAFAPSKAAGPFSITDIPSSVLDLMAMVKPRSEVRELLVRLVVWKF